MNKLTRFMAVAVLLTFSGADGVQAQDALPIPSAGVVPPIAGAQQTPDAATHYKIAFVMNEAAPNPGEVNPMFMSAARMVNTLASYGVPKTNRDIAIVIYGPATEAIRTNASFAQKNDGKQNPDLEIIKALKSEGVTIFVCGQSVAGRKIPVSEITPEVTLTLSATVTLINLQSKGYIRVN